MAMMSKPVDFFWRCDRLLLKSFHIDLALLILSQSKSSCGSRFGVTEQVYYCLVIDLQVRDLHQEPPVGGFFHGVKELLYGHAYDTGLVRVAMHSVGLS